MKRKYTLFLFITFLFLTCTLREKDTSNDPLALLSRFLIRRAFSSIINPELPSNLSVAIPRSIRKSSTGSASIRGFKRDLADEVIANGTTGLSILQDTTTVISLVLQEAKRDLVLISGVYPIAKANPGTCYRGGTTSVEIGDDANAEMLNGLKSLGLDDLEAQSNLTILQTRGVLPSPGQSIPSPAIVYRVPTDKNFDNEVNLSVADSLTTPQNCPANTQAGGFQKTIRWNNEKSRIFTSITKSLNVFSTTISITGSITYITEAGKKDKAILNIEQKSKVGRGTETTSTLKFTIQECDTETVNNSNNCSVLNLSSTTEDGSNNPIKTTIKGRTDDLGGYVKTTYDTQNLNYTIEEYYNSNEEIVWLSIDDGSGSGPETFGEIDPDLAALYNIGDFSIENTVEIDVTWGVNTEEFFVLIADGLDPNTNDDDILGYGEKIDGTISVVYLGTEEDKSILKLWKLDYSSGDAEYVLVSDADYTIN